MSVLSSKRHEAFAREVGLLGTDVELAYRMHVARPGTALRGRNGARLLSRAEVNDRIRELSAAAMEKAAELAGVDRARALAEQARIAYSNILDYVEIIDGVAKMKAVADIPRDKAAAIQSISYDSNGRLRIKLHDKVGALSALLKATETQPQDPLPPEKPAPSFDADDGWAQLTKHGPTQAATH